VPGACFVGVPTSLTKQVEGRHQPLYNPRDLGTVVNIVSHDGHIGENQGRCTAGRFEFNFRRQSHSFWMVAHTPVVLDRVHKYVARERSYLDIMAFAIENSKQCGVAAPVVLDVGSNHGLWCLVAQSLGANCVALEPQRKLSHLIGVSTALNGASERIAVLNAAVAERPGTAAIMIPRSSKSEGGTAFLSNTHSKSAISEVNEYKMQYDEQSYTVSTFPVASVLSSTSVIDMLKIDVEGLDLLALRSTYPLLKARMVNMAVVEFGPLCRWARLHESYSSSSDGEGAGGETREGSNSMHDVQRIVAEEARRVLWQIIDYGYEVRLMAKQIRMVGRKKNTSRCGVVRTAKLQADAKALVSVQYFDIKAEPQVECLLDVLNTTDWSNMNKPRNVNMDCGGEVYLWLVKSPGR